MGRYKKLKSIKLILAILLMIIGVVWGIAIIINNPDMTKMRLLLSFWREYIFITILVVVGYIFTKIK